MKNRLFKTISFLLVSLTLIGCAFRVPTPNSDDENNNDNPTNPIVPTNSDDSSDTTKRLDLNAYGDYLEYEDSSKSGEGLLEEYQKLSAEKIYSSNGILEAKYQVGLYEFFNIKNKVELKINISSSELNNLDNDYHQNNKETFRICSLDILYLGLHFHYEEVGIRQKGNTSRGAILDGDKINLRHYKLSFEETFDDDYVETKKVWTSDEAKKVREDRKFFGENKIDIRWNRNQDQTYLKEYYAFELHRSNGSLSPRSNPVHTVMVVDGVSQNLGIYLAVETVNKSFIKRNFIKSARDGDLYKLGWGSGSGASFDSDDDNLFGAETQYKSSSGTFRQKTYTYDLKTNKDTSDHTAIKMFIFALIESSGNKRKTLLQDRGLYDEFIAFSASLYICGDPDDLRANCNNAYIYFALVDNTTKIVFIPTDHDRAFGSAGDPSGNPTGNFTLSESPFSNKLGYGNANASNLFSKTIVSSNSTAIREDYISKLETIASGEWLTMNNFNKYFSLVKSNYENDLNLGSKINFPKINLSLDGSENIYGSDNLKIATYLEAKRNYITSKKW